jgi:opacity protein-like surface antigen
MKKTIFVLLLLVGMAGGSFAQDKGQFWVGGSISTGSNDEVGRVKNSNYSIAPELGYAFSDKWAMGLRVGFGQTKYAYDPEYSGTDENVDNTFSIAPFARYSFFTWKSVKLFVDGGVSYVRGKGENKEIDNVGEENEIDNGSHSTSNSYGVFISPGVSLRLGRAVSLTGSINLLNVYSLKSKIDYNDIGRADSEGRRFNTSVNSPFSLSDFSVGVNYCF